MVTLVTLFRSSPSGDLMSHRARRRVPRQVVFLARDAEAGKGSPGSPHQQKSFESSYLGAVTLLKAGGH
jgi:hypothetical protein